MSMAELPGLIAQLKECELLLDRVEVKAETVRVEVGHTRGELREAEYILFRVTSLLGRMGLPPEIDRAIYVVQKLIFTVRMLHYSMMMLEIATPYGWIMFLVGMGGMAITMGSGQILEGY